MDCGFLRKVQADKQKITMKDNNVVLKNDCIDISDKEYVLYSERWLKLVLDASREGQPVHLVFVMSIIFNSDSLNQEWSVNKLSRITSVDKKGVIKRLNAMQKHGVCTVKITKRGYRQISFNDIESFEKLAFSPKSKRTERSNPSGYVYLIKSDFGLKIGRSIHKESRINQIRQNVPFEIEVLCNYYVKDMFKLEKTLHNHFKNKRIKGEWFNLLESDIDIFRKKCMLVLV